MTRLLPSKNYYAYPVPVDATSIELYGSGATVDEIRWNMVKQAGKGLKIKTERKRIAPGNYSIICCSASATEQEASRVVEKDEPHPEWPHIDLWLNYENGEKEYLDTATESLASLLRSLGLTQENYLIIERKS